MAKLDLSNGNLAVFILPQEKDHQKSIFFAKDADEQQQIASRLEKITNSAAHDLKNGVLILVNHAN